MKKYEIQKTRYSSESNTVIVTREPGYTAHITICDYSDGSQSAAVYGKERLKVLVEVLSEVINDLPEDPVYNEDDEED